MALIVFLACGCGEHQNARPTTGGARASSQGRIPDNPSEESIADSTRAVTIRRRGQWSLSADSVQKISGIVSKTAQIYQLPEDLIYGIIWVESRFDPKAVSPVGARGLMQLMPRTARYLADCIKWENRANAFDPDFNIAAGTYYISRLIRDFNGDETLALAAYNAGPGKVRRWIREEGLPRVSIEYATMVQTARTFFTKTITEKSDFAETPSPVITTDELDRLGLTILIAGLSDKSFGLEREDVENPFN